VSLLRDFALLDFEIRNDPEESSPQLISRMCLVICSLRAPGKPGLPLHSSPFTEIAKTRVRRIMTSVTITPDHQPVPHFVFTINNTYRLSGTSHSRPFFTVLSGTRGKLRKVSSSRCRKMSAKVIGGAFPTNDCSGNSWLFDRFSQG
jgi:hypothetical protein